MSVYCFLTCVIPLASSRKVPEPLASTVFSLALSAVVMCAAVGVWFRDVMFAKKNKNILLIVGGATQTACIFSFCFFFVFFCFFLFFSVFFCFFCCKLF